MSKSVQLMAGVYTDHDRGKVILDTLQAMHHENTITLIDAALLTKTDDGKLKVEETAELTGKKGARRGAAILGVIGLVFPPSFIASVLVGGGVGAVAGKLRDTGIKKNDMRQIAEQLEPGKSAVMALSEAESVPRIEGALQGYEGQLLSQELGTETATDVIEIAETPPPSSA